MGGCKCTYKNCTVKSDGKTHLFHYPVFNKIRCHQWIINAQRYELLDLKVSQLKNRVICQYHFKNEDFMNCQNAKLTKDAIPTQDGPFCDSKKWNKEHNYVSGLPLITEDIENEDLPYEEKVKNYSIKYADFLTNFEPELLTGTNFDSCNLDIKTGTIKYSDRLAFQSNNSLTTELDDFKVDSGKDTKRQEIEKKAVISEDKSLLQDPLPMIEKMSSTLNNSNKEDCFTNFHSVKNNSFSTTPYKNNTKESKVRILSEKKMKNAMKLPDNLQPVSPSILITLPRQKNISMPITSSEQTIVSHNINLRDNEEQSGYSLHYNTSENVHPTYSLDLNCLKYDQPASLYTLQVNRSQENHQPTTLADLNVEFQNVGQPLYTIDRNGEKQKCLPNSFDTNEGKQDTRIILNPVAPDSNKPISMAGPQLLNNILPNENSVLKLLDDKYTTEVEFDPKFGTKCDETPEQPNSKLIDNKKGVSQLKSRMSPNRLAKIEEKRTFNKKLVGACIELEKSLQQTSSPKRKFVKLDNSNCSNEKNKTQVSSYLSEDPKLPSVHEYTLKLLEDRLQQMENRLLCKIDQNSQKIQEIKESLKPSPKQKAASIQTNLDGNEETYKRHLYHEISQFLRPNCRSALYEELFINKFSLDNEVVVKNKRRRCR